MSPATGLGTLLMNVILFSSHSDHTELGTITCIFYQAGRVP